MNRVFAAALLACALLAPAALAQSQTTAPAARAMPRIGMVHVHVADLDRSEQFYRQVFGLGPARAYNARERVFTLADQDGPRLELVLADAPHANGSFTMLVPNIDAVMTSTPLAGGAVVRAPGAPANNYRSGVITDPDGVEIEILQPMPRE